MLYEEGLMDQILKRNDENSFFRELIELFLPNCPVAIMYSFTDTFGVSTPSDAFEVQITSLEIRFLIILVY